MENRRVQYTKKAIQQSLLELLKNKPIEKITVTELCKKADINRSTFYAHYLDVFDLLEKIEEELYDEMIDVTFGPHDPEDTRPYMLRIIELIISHKELCGTLFGKFGDHDFLVRLTSMGWSPKEHSFEENCMRSYIAAGAASAMFTWLTSGQEASPAEFAELITQMNEAVENSFLEKKEV